MKWWFIIPVFALAVFAVTRKNTGARVVGKTQAGSGSSFALLELFTSEGCSSCPAADRLLPQLAAEDSRIIPISFHVDYWDRMGWKDRFSNADFTKRQQVYGQIFKLESIYTPQLVINGEYEIVGSDKSDADNYIRNSLARKATIQLAIEEVKKEKDKLLVALKLDGNLDGMKLCAALVQKHAESQVGGGENKGSKLVHTNTVRTFLSFDARGKLNFEISIPADLTDDNWKLIVFTQQEKDFKVTSAAAYPE